MIQVTKEQEDKLATYDKKELTQSEFEALPEYSMSVPTISGGIGVKRFKRRTPLNASSENAIWFYGEHSDEDQMWYFSHIIITD